MAYSKVILVGNSASGKTTTCYKVIGYPLDYFFDYTNLVKERFDRKITTTMGVEIEPFRPLSGGKYNIWDCAGKEKLRGLGDRYYVEAKIALIFHGGENYRTPEQWIQEVRSVVPNVQIYHITGTWEQKYHQMRQILV